MSEREREERDSVMAEQANFAEYRILNFTDRDFTRLYCVMVGFQNLPTDCIALKKYCEKCRIDYDRTRTELRSFDCHDKERWRYVVKVNRYARRLARQLGFKILTTRTEVEDP